MAEDNNKVEIKDVVKRYIEVDIQNEKENPNNQSNVLNILGECEVEYFKGMRKLHNESKAINGALLNMETHTKDLYQDLVNSTNSSSVKDETNKKVVLNTIEYQLRLLFIKERKDFSRIFSSNNPIPTLEESYIEHIKDLVNWASPYVFTEYVLDRNVFVFARRMSEVYTYKQYNQTRGEQYFRLMYFLQGDPRKQEYGIRSVPGVNVELLSRLLTKYILTSEQIKDKVETKEDAREYFNKLRMWDGMSPYNTVGEGEFKKAYLGAIAMSNMAKPNKDLPLAMRETVRTILKEELRRKGISGDSIDEGVYNTVKMVKMKGVAIKEVGGLTFIFGNRLFVLKGENEDMKILGSLSYTKANSGAVKTLLKKSTVKGQQGGVR